MNDFTLDVVCTCRGVHEEDAVYITTVTVNEDGSGGWVSGPRFAAPDVMDDCELPIPQELRRDDNEPNKVFVAMCEQCGRTPELRPETFRHLVATLKAHGVSSLDISQLPF